MTTNYTNQGISQKIIFLKPDKKVKVADPSVPCLKSFLNFETLLKHYISIEKFDHFI